jgi:hypothetical protein
MSMDKITEIQPATPSNAKSDPPSEPANSARPSIVSLDKLPPVLQKERKKLRDMVKARCEEPDSPIPPKLAISAADAAFFLLLYRVTARAMLGRPAFPDADTLANDIARAAESIEICVQAMGQEVVEEVEPLIDSPNPGNIIRIK